MSERKDTWESDMKAQYEYGKQYLTGGVSSVFRVNRFTDLPTYINNANGAYLYDITGKEYIDFFMGHGSVLLGHKHPEVNEALLGVLEGGFFSAYDSNMNIELAKLITEIIPCSERVIFANSGSEATQLAIRLARGYTGREKIIRIDGHFHGVHDYVLSNNLAAYTDENNPGDRLSKVKMFSSGIPKVIEETMIVMPWNNIELFAEIVKKQGENIAGIIMNAVDYNNGCLLTDKEYLSEIERISKENGIIFILDEVLTGFKTGISCAQGYYGIKPDLCTLAKALSNGVPISVVTGKKEIMEMPYHPEHRVFNGGTYSGNRLGSAAAIASLKIMKEYNFYEELFKVSNYFFKNLQKLFDDKGIIARVPYLGCMFHIYFGIDEPVTNYRQFKNIDWKLAKEFFKNCIKEGLYFSSDFIVSAAHSIKDIDIALEKMEKVIKKLKK